MLKLLVAALIALASTSAIAADITNDSGGSVSGYYWHYRNLDAKGERIRIDGYCGSACTMALGYPYTCVTPRAVLGFHAAYFWPAWFGKVTAPNETALMWSHYPAGIRRWITARGGLTHDMKYLKGVELARLVKRC